MFRDDVILLNEMHAGWVSGPRRERKPLAMCITAVAALTAQLASARNQDLFVQVYMRKSILTLSTNDCGASQLQEAHAQQTDYLKTIYKQNAADPALCGVIMNTLRYRPGLKKRNRPPPSTSKRRETRRAVWSQSLDRPIIAVIL